MPGRGVCVYCNHRRRAGNNRLCWPCRQRPEARAFVRGLGRKGKCPARGNRQPDWNAARSPLPRPTAALPGTPEKVEVLAGRVRLRQSLWHPADAGMAEFCARRLSAGRPTAFTTHDH